MSVDREILLKLQHDVIVAANEADTLRSALRAAIHILCGGLGWSAGEVYRVTESGGPALESTDIFYVVADRGDGIRQREMLRELIASAGAAVEQLLRSARPVTVGPGRARGRGRRRPRPHFAALFPIIIDDRIFAALAFLSERSIELDERLESFMEGVAVQLGLVIRRSSLEERLASHATEEQRRVGHELHDTIGQQVVAIALGLRVLREEMERAGSRFSGRVATVAEQLDWVSDQIRSIIDGLLPVEVEAGSFREVIEGLPSYCRRQYSIDCAVELQGDVRPPDSLAATNLVHITREAIRNATHHGGAEHVRISVVGSADSLVLKVEDDGSGLGETENLAGGHGLDIMRFRCRTIGGSLNIANRAEGGAVLTCTVPRSA